MESRCFFFPQEKERERERERKKKKEKQQPCFSSPLDTELGLGGSEKACEAVAFVGAKKR